MTASTVRPAPHQAGDHERPQRLRTGQVEGGHGAAAGVGHRLGEGGVGEDGVGEAGQGHGGSRRSGDNTTAPAQAREGVPDQSRRGRARPRRRSGRAAGWGWPPSRPRTGGCRTRCPPGRRGSPSRCRGRTSRGGRRPAWRRGRAAARAPRPGSPRRGRRSKWIRFFTDLTSGTSMKRSEWPVSGSPDHALLVARQVRVAVDVDVPEHRLPPLGELVGVGAVDGRVRDEGGHDRHSRRSPRAAQPRFSGCDASSVRVTKIDDSSHLPATTAPPPVG